MKIPYYHGHTVFAKSSQGLAIAIILSDDGVTWLSQQQYVERVLTTTGLGNATFVRQEDFLGVRFVCAASSQDPVQAEFEARNIREVLEYDYGFCLRAIDGKYCRDVDLQQAA